MNCCARHVDAAGRCFGFLSKCHVRRYRRKGPDDLQRALLGRLETLGVEGKSLLDVGCGVGVLHQSLLARGAGRAIGVDLAPAMLERARERARALGLGDRVEYRLGDFVLLHEELDPADLVLLDKVVCCYPEAEALLDAAARRTRGALALVYPRRHRLGRISKALWNCAFRLSGSEFRSYLHDPAALHRWLEERGLRRAFGRDTLMWHARIYVAA